MFCTFSIIAPSFDAEKVIVSRLFDALQPPLRFLAQQRVTEGSVSPGARGNDQIAVAGAAITGGVLFVLVYGGGYLLFGT